MPIRQLTLYDFLADFVPGTLALVVGAQIFTVLGIVSVSPPTGVSAGAVTIVLSFLSGRIVHAFAGQDFVKKLRKHTFDRGIFFVESKLDTLDREKIDQEPTFPDFLADNLDLVKNPRPETIDARIETELPKLVADEFNEFNEYGVRNSPKELRRLGYSILFGESTLYHRYNIIETFYRNLWLVAFLGGLALCLALWHTGCNPAEVNCVFIKIEAIGLVVLSVLFDARRVQFKDRQVRALVNDLYLHFAEGDSEGEPDK